MEKKIVITVQASEEQKSTARKRTAIQTRAHVNDTDTRIDAHGDGPGTAAVAVAAARLRLRRARWSHCAFDPRDRFAADNPHRAAATLSVRARQWFSASIARYQRRATTALRSPHAPVDASQPDTRNAQRRSGSVFSGRRARRRHFCRVRSSSLPVRFSRDRGLPLPHRHLVILRTVVGASVRSVRDVIARVPASSGLLCPPGRNASTNNNNNTAQSSRYDGTSGHVSRGPTWRKTLGRPIRVHSSAAAILFP